MATARIRQQRKSSLRRLAAKNFLSNISLDGTHNDTNYLFHVWKKHKHKNVNNHVNTSERCDDNVTVHVIGLNENSEENQIKGELHSYTPLKQNEHDGQNMSVTVRPRSSTMYQINEEHYKSHIEQPEITLTPDRNSKRWRASSCSGEKEKASIRRKLIQYPADTVSSIRESIDRSMSRQSSSVSGDSFESHDVNIRFISPDSRRRIKNDRVVIVSNSRAPLVVSSTLPYIREVIGRHEAHDEVTPIMSLHRNRHMSGTRSISSTEDMFLLGQKIVRGDDAPDISYSELLEPSKKAELRRAVSESRITTSDNLTGRVYTRSISEDPHLLAARGSIISFALDRVVEEEESDTYDPNLLDDPELQSGGYRTVLNFPSYMTSVIDYVKPSTLKKELNEKFKDRFPNIQLTLTKFRSLKKEMRSIGHGRCNIDLWNVAQAYVFFEKLILKMLISKQNRKLCAGACLMLSAKLNDIKGQELSKLIDQIEDDFRLNRKEMLAYEFATLVALDFSLLIADSEIYPHYQRLLYQS